MKLAILAIGFFTTLGILNISNNSYDYEKAWLEVEKFIRTGLPKSALEKVEEIYTMATQEKNEPQLIKSLIYIVRLTVQTDEKGIESVIARLNTEIERTKAPTKAILTSYLAELYANYFTAKRYEISQRSNLTSESGDDFRTWTTQDFYEKISALYLASVEDQSTLNESPEKFKAIISVFDSTALVYKPSLYELLADRAMAYFNEANGYEQKNITSFHINDSLYFASSKKFITQDVAAHFKKENKSSLTDVQLKASPLFNAIRLYQDMLRLKSEKDQKEALAYYDINRLAFVFKSSELENKRMLYINSLEKLAVENENHSLYSEIAAHIAEQYQSDVTDSLATLKALDWSSKGIKKFPDSPGAGKCQNIINNIKSPSIQLFGESIYTSEKAILFAMDYNNIPVAETDIIRIDRELPDGYVRGDQDEFIKYIKAASALISAKQVLPSSPYYKKQRMEMGFKSLPYGNYALRAKARSEEGREVFQYLLFSVTDLAYTTWMEGDSRVYLITDRTKGIPQSNVKVTLSYSEYDQGLRKMVNRKLGDWTSGKDGKVRLKIDERKSVKVVLTKGKDSFDGSFYHSNYPRYESDPEPFAEIFTDRSIYRPGQTIYYKAILLDQDKNRVPSIIKNESVNISLKDANYQVVSTITQISNEFGSVSGSFVIPVGKLTGSYSIHVESASYINSYRSVQVEEYKRPTFEVSFEPVTETFKINDKIVIKAKALTLAGSSVDDAQVTYKVIRTARFPWWDWWWRLPNPTSEFVIAQGTVLTDAEGAFQIAFDAIPDLNVGKTYSPVFHYRVDVDVTDQRGETRSAATSVSAAYTAFGLSTDMPSRIDKPQAQKMTINAINTNGQQVDVIGTYRIFQLKQPANVLIKKYWDGITDLPVPFQEHKKLFPQYPFNNEADFNSWEKDKKITEAPFRSGEAIPVASLFQSGVYKMEMTSKDADGTDVQAVKYFVVTDFNNKKFPKSEFLFSTLNQKTYQPGETMILKLGASDKTIHTNVIVEKDGNILFSNIMKVSSLAHIQLPITEQYRGGLHVKVRYIIQNRNYEESHYVDVPWTNKQLEIVFETFRDKTLPGSQEQYLIKIKGKDKDKVAAEMLASMYDASLDQFAEHSWRQSFYPGAFSAIYTETPGFQLSQGRHYDYSNAGYVTIKAIRYPALMALFNGDLYGYSDNVYSYDMQPRRSSEAMMMKSAAPEAAPSATVNGGNENNLSDSVSGIESETTKNTPPQPPRANLKETVFFFPELKTDNEGNIVLSFTINEALTKWRLMSFAHTSDFKTAYDERFVQTSKDLMIFPNPPRFLRDGDKLNFSAKVTNLSERTVSGNATIIIKDAITLKDITSEIVKSAVKVPFSAEKGRSEGVYWNLDIPEAKYQALTWTVRAESAGHTDAEENTLPVITNRVMITESMPIWVRGNESKTVIFKSFRDNLSPTKKDYKYTFEYTAHPVWYAIQALPYIQNTGSASTQAIIDRFFTNTLASNIANAHPRIKAVFDQWQNNDKEALLSNLFKNEELKNAILEETPWVRQSMSEAEQKRNIAVLFDLNRLSGEQEAIISKLAERQMTNGGFPWFDGGRDDIYTTQLILEVIGQLKHLGALQMDDSKLTQIVSKGLQYMDIRLEERYKRLLENISKYGGKKEDDHLDELSVHYLYVRSFFKNYRVGANASEAKDYYNGQARQYWLKRGLYSQAMIGLIMHRNSDITSKQIIRSLRERSFSNEELGMYWNEGNGFYWYQLPIERHSMMISLFSEAGGNQDETDSMKIWLLKNKQTNHWKTSKATSAALYALLIQGEKGGMTPWIKEVSIPEIQVGKSQISAGSDIVQAGTGYLKQTWASDAIVKEMATIKVHNKNSSVAWGAAYYQYLEVLDNVKGFEDTPLKINKQWYKVLSDISGDKLEAINDNSRLKPGDKIKVRIEIRVDRNMEYIHLKDMRPSGFEPQNTISGYRYQGGLGYYESTRDMATHFYFSYLPKGTYVFEYPLIVVHKGNFTGGITSIESMYAPEFRSHSAGNRIKVGD